MALTLDQAKAELESLKADHDGNAEVERRQGEECRKAASESDDPDLRRRLFDDSSSWFGQARWNERQSEAISIVLKAVRS